MPRPFSVKTWPAWVPAGILTRALPSSVGTSISTPRAACAKLSGTSHTTSFPSRTKSGCSRTLSTT